MPAYTAVEMNEFAVARRSGGTTSATIEYISGLVAELAAPWSILIPNKTLKFGIAPVKN